MVLNDIIEQAAGRHSRASGDHGGRVLKPIPFQITTHYDYKKYIKQDSSFLSIQMFKKR